MSEQLKQAIDDAGGATAIAHYFGISTVSVYEWISRGCVPADKAPEIEKFSGGAVRCERLNDKVDWAYIRGTQAA